MGWSDETEMLARLYSLIAKHLGQSDLNWEKCLPAKYVGAADYSLIDDTVDPNLSAQLKAGLQGYRDIAAENRKNQK